MALMLLPLLAAITLCAGVGVWAWTWFSSPDPVARVLFCETANCTPQERLLVAGVMKNRIGHAAFGNVASLRAVVGQPDAFSCVGDRSNSNWARTRYPARLTPAEQVIWRQCLALAQGDIPPTLGPSGRPLVFYHDKSIGKPASWDTQDWHVVRERTTPHLVFYSIVRAGK